MSKYRYCRLSGGSLVLLALLFVVVDLNSDLTVNVVNVLMGVVLRPPHPTPPSTLSPAAFQHCRSLRRYWVMSLRGIGERKCNVGNIFSGLTCDINDRMPPPRAVRKPTGRPADATRKRTWRNSEALSARKRQLAPTLRSLRPQQLQSDETDGKRGRYINIHR